MKLKYCDNYDEMSKKSVGSIISDLRSNPEQLLCTATGYSPLGTYKNLADAFDQEPKIFEKLRIIKLDEWGGISSTELTSCESYTLENVILPLKISSERYISFESNSTSPAEECERIQKAILREGPIDICILGLGKNGHIGFNEPSETMTEGCHVAQLTQASLQHQMVSDMKNIPTYGLTLGMTDILQSKKIVLLVTGSGKKDTITRLMSKVITNRLPASHLWSHPNVECYIDSTAML